MKTQTVAEKYAEKSFQLYVLETKKLVDADLSKVISALPTLKLRPQIEYAVLSKGKRLRPLLVVLSAEGVGSDRKKVMPLALAFEFLHTATLVHDDIIDGDELRRGIATLHKKWSVNDAILAGDAMIAVAVNLASNYGERIINVVSQTALKLCEGEKMDPSFSLETATQEEYFQKIREKSASLFRAATYSGALAGGGSPLEIDCLSMFGENFGIAYQLRDDLLDLNIKGDPASVLKDLKTGQIPLALIHSYMVTEHDNRDQLKNNLKAIMKSSKTGNSVLRDSVITLLRQTDSFHYCEQKIDEYLQKAVGSIAPLKDSEYKAHLVRMAQSLKTMG